MSPEAWISLAAIGVVVTGACIGWMNAVYKKLAAIDISVAGIVPRINQLERRDSDLFRKLEDHDTEINNLNTAVAVMRGKTA